MSMATQHRYLKKQQLLLFTNLVLVACNTELSTKNTRVYTNLTLLSILLKIRLLSKSRRSLACQTPLFLGRAPLSPRKNAKHCSKQMRSAHGHAYSANVVPNSRNWGYLVALEKHAVAPKSGWHFEIISHSGPWSESSKCG